MARYEASIFGRIQGKIGDAIGQYWKGVKYIRSFVTPTDRRSQAQLNVRQCWALTATIYRLAQSILFWQLKSGLQFFSLFKKDYAEFQRVTLRQARTNIANFGLVSLDRTLIEREYETTTAEFDSADNSLIVSINLYLQSPLPDAAAWTDSAAKGCFILFDYTTKETSFFSLGSPETIEIFGGSKTAFGITGKAFNFSPKSIYLYFYYIEAPYTLNGVTTTLRQWYGGKWSNPDG